MNRNENFSRIIHHSSRTSGSGGNGGVETILTAEADQEYGTYAKLHTTNLGRPGSSHSILLFPEDIKALRIALEGLESWAGG
jgi:hypothetical protein